MIREGLQLRYAAAILFLALGIGAISSPAQPDSTPSKELVQYIRNAKKQGVTDERIRQQAITLGWTSAAVNAALSSAKERAEAAPPAGGSAETAPAAAPGGNTAVHGVADDYQIGSGDTLQIAVWKEPDVTVPSVVVRPDGRITVPLIKEVAVAGLTPREVEKVITEGLSKFINDANVTVVVASINSKKVYVIGAVRKEGTLPYTYGMTVMQALSEAGGLTDYAKRKKIYVLRTEAGREYRLDFNYEEAVRGERMEQNVILLPGDTVVIPH